MIVISIIRYYHIYAYIDKESDELSFENEHDKDNELHTHQLIL